MLLARRHSPNRLKYKNPHVKVELKDRISGFMSSYTTISVVLNRQGIVRREPNKASIEEVKGGRCTL